MKIVLFIAIALSEASFASEEINPCINYTTINNVDRRAVGNVLKLGIIPSLSDDFLDSEWYRINSDAGEQMPTEAPGLFHCGTWYPIWLNGTLPNIIGEEIAGKVCLQGIYAECFTSWTIDIKLCPGNYLVYNLVESTNANSAYCFGTAAVNKELTTTNAATTTQTSVTDNQVGGLEPCIDHKLIDFQEKRAVANIFNVGEDTPISDDLLDSGWYRVQRDACGKMPTTAPGLLQCGTWYPIWLDGQLPVSVGGKSQGKVCMQTFTHNCTYSWNIDIKLCDGGYFVYNLLRSNIASSGYCFGTTEVCAVGNSDGTKNVKENEENKANILMIALIATTGVAVLVAIVFLVLLCKKTKQPEKIRNYLVGGKTQNGKLQKMKCNKAGDSPPPYKRGVSISSLSPQILSDSPPPYCSRESSNVTIREVEAACKKVDPFAIFTVKN
ncbi:Hypothetical predicted protein [Mytilus galloprovincialis]|uniref:UMOD/GP2/OIT3-like D8C domain-containing protein n=1 Tax=Mytilus galloprovincialis TaxID=29158 RepID=A0A8B6HMI6_MYTGA|nr:Hypothetical predicted protein [Mytilus galloprovincialis]